jgi:hypothetical protein
VGGADAVGSGRAETDGRALADGLGGLGLALTWATGLPLPLHADRTPAQATRATTVRMASD